MAKFYKTEKLERDSDFPKLLKVTGVVSLFIGTAIAISNALVALVLQIPIDSSNLILSLFLVVVGILMVDIWYFMSVYTKTLSVKLLYLKGSVDTAKNIRVWDPQSGRFYKTYIPPELYKDISDPGTDLLIKLNLFGQVREVALADS